MYCVQWSETAVRRIRSHTHSQKYSTLTPGVIVLRGEHERSNGHSSSALDRGITSHAAHLPSIVAIISTSSHVKICPLTLLSQAEESFMTHLMTATDSIHGQWPACLKQGVVGAREKGVRGRPKRARVKHRRWSIRGVRTCCASGWSAFPRCGVRAHGAHRCSLFT